MDKPKIKDMVPYFTDHRNWFDIWANGYTGLHIQKLRHVKCLRLVLEDHQINEYVHYDESVLKYFPGAEDLRDMHIVPARTDLPMYDIKELIKIRWTEYE